MKLYAEIALPLPLNRTFLYEVPTLWAPRAKIGSRVLVSFHNRTLTGFILALKKRRPTQTLTIKEIDEVLDENPVFSASMIRFVQKLSEYNHSSLGELLHAALPAGYVLKGKREVFVTEKGKLVLKDDELNLSEKKLLALYEKKSYSMQYIKRITGIKNVSVILNRLETEGYIRIEKTLQKPGQKKILPSEMMPAQLEMDFSLDTELFQASTKMTSSLGKDVFSPFFLHGPSARREPIYFDLIKKNLALKKSTLFLVPEISFTEDFTLKIKKRFGERVALIHSQMTQKQRGGEWRRIKEGDAQIVVGARSALFAPLENLSLIIIDEEQDESYFQKENPIYDARQGAWIRAQQQSALLVYGASSPSVERYFQAKQHGHLISLSSESPQYRARIVECRPNTWKIEFDIRYRIQEHLKQKKQILVFFNRRGYAPFLICSGCSYIPRCHRCDIGLTYHKTDQRMSCHYCGYSASRPRLCPKCGEKIILGKSVGIEAIEEDLVRLFPQAKMAAFHLDSAGNKKEQSQIIEKFSSGDIDLLLGTQLLLRQRDLPPVSLVVALFPETALSLSDFRASQKTFQSLRQMTSFLNQDARSEFLVQTAFSPHFSIRQAVFGDYQSFYNQELRFRSMMQYPPFGAMAEILLYGENVRILAKSSRAFLKLIEGHVDKIEMLGPAFAPVSRVRGQNRVQVILKSKKKKELDNILSDSIPQIKIRKSVYVYENFD